MNARSHHTTTFVSLVRSFLAGVWYAMVTALALVGLAAIVIVPWVVGSGRLSGLPLGSASVERLLPPVSPLGLGGSTSAEPSSQARPVIYLNREGGLIVGGEADDSSRNVSSVVGTAGLERYEAPAFRGSAQRWDEIVACTRQEFAAYDVDVVDERPVGGSYVMVMVGGQPGDLASGAGYRSTRQSRITGLAPLGQQPIPDAIVYVFAREMRERARDVCETVAHEAGHAFGLDHVLDCHDPMTHLQRCGQRTFQTGASACGEQEPRACVDGQPAQSSHERLLEVLGPRAAAGA